MRPLVILCGIFQAGTLGAQCIGTLAAELDGLGRVVAGSVQMAKPSDKGFVRVDSLKKHVQDEALFLSTIVGAGSNASCIRDRFGAFKSAALEKLVGDSLPVATATALLHQATAATLADRYQSTDRFSLVVGVGVGAVLSKRDNRLYKVVTRHTLDDSGAPTADSLQIVRVSRSRAFPAVSTGVLVRFREQSRAGYGTAAVVPNAAFASAQLSATDGRPVNGAAIGLGWTVVGSATFLIGYSVQRSVTLREDLQREFDKAPTRRLALAPGETSESIMGNEMIGALTFTMALPVSFKGSFSP